MIGENIWIFFGTAFLWTAAIVYGWYRVRFCKAIVNKSRKLYIKRGK